jgi:hypothetical protein
MLMQITEGSLTSHVKPMAKSPNAGCQKWNLVLAHIILLYFTGDAEASQRAFMCKVTVYLQITRKIGRFYQN